MPAVALDEREHERGRADRDRRDPARSRRSCPTVSSRDSRAANSVTASAITAIGGLMKKIARQLTCSVRKPPSTGPIASAIALTPAQVPIAMPRCSGGNAWVMIDSVAGIMNAAPTPWTARKATSAVSFGAKPDRGAREPEHDHAEQEHPPASEDVAEPAAGDHQHGERERVGVDGPLERGQRGMEAALNRRQRDVHDRVVEHHHEQREAHRAERPPPAVLVGHQAMAVARIRCVMRRLLPVGRPQRPRARAASRAPWRACAVRPRSRSAVNRSSPLRRASVQRRITVRPGVGQADALHPAVLDVLVRARRSRGGRGHRPSGSRPGGRRGRSSAASFSVSVVIRLLEDGAGA